LGLSHSPSIVMNGLVLALDAANTKSYPGTGTTWTDLSGRGNTGTLTLGPTYSSANGGSIVFDGVDDYVNLNNKLDLTLNTFSYSCWFYPTEFNIVSGIDGNTIFSRENARHYLAFTSNGYYRIFLRGNLFSTNGAVEGGIGDTSNVLLNTWNNVFVNIDWNTSTFSVYHNSSLIWSLTNALLGTSFVDTTTQDAVLGSRYNGGGGAAGSRFKGRMGNFLFYNRVFTAAEIQQNFNALRGRYGI
jgi:hypothetical protein